jgi:hypothetical protein
MLTELQKIRAELMYAVARQDWWLIKAQINRLDTVIYNESRSNDTENIPSKK